MKIVNSIKLTKDDGDVYQLDLTDQHHLIFGVGSEQLEQLSNCWYDQFQLNNVASPLDTRVDKLNVQLTTDSINGTITYNNRNAIVATDTLDDRFIHNSRVLSNVIANINHFVWANAIVDSQFNDRWLKTIQKYHNLSQCKNCLPNCQFQRVTNSNGNVSIEFNYQPPNTNIDGYRRYPVWTSCVVNGSDYSELHAIVLLAFISTYCESYTCFASIPNTIIDSVDPKIKLAFARDITNTDSQTIVFTSDVSMLNSHVYDNDQCLLIDKQYDVMTAVHFQNKTTRFIRPGNNLMNLYLSGEFDD